jgi:diguanylate cyclase (GGDEF)-like protein
MPAADETLVQNVTEAVIASRGWDERAHRALELISGTAFLLVDPTFTVRWASETFGHIFRFDPVGRPALSLLHEDDRQFAGALLVHHEEGHDNDAGGAKPTIPVDLASAEVRMLDVDGVEINLMVSLQSMLAVPDVDGYLVRLVVPRDNSALYRAIDHLGNGENVAVSLADLADLMIIDAHSTSRPPWSAVVYHDAAGRHVASNSIPPDLLDALTGDAVADLSADGHNRVTPVEELPPGPARDIGMDNGFRSVWTVPITIDGGTVGGTFFIWSAILRTSMMRHSPTYTLAAGLGRMALVEHHRRLSLTNRALIDDLTGIRNRRGLTKALGDPASSQLASALFIDLDDFKRINDQFGHLAGDDVLAEIGQRLTRHTRSSDVVARIGGDEFVVLTKLTDEFAVKQFADRLLDMLCVPHSIDGRAVTVSASIGVALDIVTTELDMAMALADAAMFGAKRKGKGRVAVARVPAL